MSVLTDLAAELGVPVGTLTVLLSPPRGDRRRIIDLADAVLPLPPTARLAVDAPSWCCAEALSLAQIAAGLPSPELAVATSFAAAAELLDQAGTSTVAGHAVELLDQAAASTVAGHAVELLDQAAASTVAGTDDPSPVADPGCGCGCPMPLIYYLTATAVTLPLCWDGSSWTATPAAGFVLDFGPGDTTWTALATQSVQVEVLGQGGAGLQSEGPGMNGSGGGGGGYAVSVLTVTSGTAYSVHVGPDSVWNGATPSASPGGDAMSVTIPGTGGIAFGDTALVGADGSIGSAPVGGNGGDAGNYPLSAGTLAGGPGAIGAAGPGTAGTSPGGGGAGGGPPPFSAGGGGGVAALRITGLPTTVTFSCISGVWTLTVNETPYTPSAVIVCCDCLIVQFAAVDLTPLGGAGLGTVSVATCPQPPVVTD